MNKLNPTSSYNSCLENSNILVVGLGLTGASIIDYLLSKDLSFRVIDSRENPPNVEHYQKLGIEIILGGLLEEHFIWAETIILSPGISENETVIKNARNNGKIIVGDIELFLAEVNTPVVAITGSNGKSTVTSMMASIGRVRGSDFKISIGGNIGIPALSLLQQESDLYVLELSSFQLETIDNMKFVTAVILNLSEDHMDRYDSFDDYCKAKLKLLNSMGNIILNYDDVVIQRYSSLFNGKLNLYWFTLNQPSLNQYGVIEINQSKWICFNDAGEIIKLLDCTKLKVFGEHNISNAMVALMIARLSNISDNIIQSGLIQFTGLAHRSQLVKIINGVSWINDSKATNIGATSAAISGLKENSIILILGGQSKGQDFSVLNTAITSNVKLIILIGEDAELISKSLDNTIRREIYSDLEQAVSSANNNAKTSDIVLFSPACASFDMFNGFEHRGECFVNLVEAISQ